LTYVEGLLRTLFFPPKKPQNPQPVDGKAALRFLRKAIGHPGVPEKITIDKSGANKAAIESYNAEHQADVEILQVKYLTDVFDKTFFSKPHGEIVSVFN
jgi:hypothetical protein